MGMTEIISTGDAFPGRPLDDLVNTVLCADVDADRRAVEDQHTFVAIRLHRS
jgi:hypothetical protein